MKQKLLKAMLLLCALVVGGASPVWADEGDEITSIANIVDGKSYYIKGVRSSKTYYLSFTDATGSQSGTESSTTSGAQLITFHQQSTGVYYLETASGNFIAPGTSNGKIQVAASGINVTASNQSSKIRLSITSGSNTWSIQKNTGAANFGGYKNTQTDITLIEGPAAVTPCATPTFSPAAGTYTSAQTVTISTETAGATIYYTTDGSTPTSSSTPYGSAITVSETQTIKAIAVKDGNSDSKVATAAYTITSAVATTTAIDASGITNTDVYVNTAAGSLSAAVTETDSGDAVAGATVSWSGDNDAVATINESTGAVTLVSAGTVTFTANYAGVTDEYTSSSDTYEMTVTNSEPYVQPTSINITPNYSFWDKTGSFSGNTYDELSGSKENVSLSWSRGSGSTYANTTAMRFYKDNALTFTAPTGYEIKSIELDVTGTYSDLTFSPSGYDNGTTTWTGSASEVTMSRPSNASSYATISKFTITLAKGKDSPSLTVSPAELSLGYGETKSFTVSKSGDGDLTVESNNISIATVAADGETAGQYNVTYVGDGNTTITVTSSETSTYVGDTKTVTITALDARSAAGISFASDSKSAVIADGTSFTQALTNTNSVSPITWTSSDETVATVATDGTVTLKKAGTVTITASFAGDATYKPAVVSYTLTITNKHVATLVFDADAIEKNSTDAAFTNDIATEPDGIGILYSSSNTSVATIDSDGEVTIVGGGTTTITATINDDAYEATEYTYTLTVNKVAAPISFSSASATTALDETESFVAPTLSNPQSLTIAYSSSDTDVATVNASTGAITFIAAGNTTITATSTATAKYNSGEVSYTLTVTKAAENLPFTAALTSTLGDFTVTPDATLGNLWSIDSGAKASAYKDRTQNDGESWLISPYINITSAYATLSFEHADRYFHSEAEMKEEATLWIREKGGDWEELTIATYPEYTGSTKSDFVSTSNSLSTYSGKKVQIGFKYLGNNNSAGSWWVKSFRVADDREEAPISFADATVYELLKNKDTYEGQELTNTESLTVSYTSSNTDVATVNASTGVVTIKAVGETDITATYAETASYKANTATYKLVVTSKTAPAIEYAEDAASKKITLGTYTHTLTNPNDLTVAYSSSDETVATVNVSTGEVTMLKVGSTTITATFTEDETYDGGTASYTLTVIKDDPELSFTKSSVNAGLAEGTYTQAVTTTPADLPVTYSSSDETVATVDPSTGEATLLKTGSTTITASYAGNDSYNSANTTYTLNVVVDYAELPFSYNSNKGSIGTTLTSGTTGLMQSGLGDDYSSSSAPNTQLKFDSQGDYVILKFAEIPGTLTFSIKNNSFSGGAFTVQTSTDGETYTDLKEYKSISGTQNESFYLADDVRYVKWIYTKRSSGNVGLGNINVGKPVKFNANGYATFACASDLDFTDKDYTAWIVTAVIGDAITFSQVNEAPANTGLLLMGTAGNTANITTTSGVGALSETNLLEAITTPTKVSDDQYFGLIGNQFKKVNAGTVPAGKALLPASEVPAEIKSFTFIFETATGVRTVEKVSAAEAEAIFNLAGQRIQKPQRGINIVNGRKVVVK